MPPISVGADLTAATHIRVALWQAFRLEIRRCGVTRCRTEVIPLRAVSFDRFAEENANHLVRFASNHSDNQRHLKKTKQSLPMLTMTRRYPGGTKSDGRFAEPSAQRCLKTAPPAPPLRL